MNPLIKELRSIRGLKLICPSCEEEISVSRLEIADMYANDNPKIAKRITHLIQDQEYEKTEIGEQIKALRKQRKEKPLRVQRATESTNIGKIVEKIVPSFTAFPYDRGDCRALFEPIDYVIFKGLSRSNITNIEIVDVKTGAAKLSESERTIKSAIEDGSVIHDVIKGKRQ